MQSQPETIEANASKRYGHRRSDTLGKAMSVTSLLLNCPPPTMSTLRTGCMRDGRTPDDDRPPLFFRLESSDASTLEEQFEKPLEKNKNEDSSHSSSDHEIDLEQEYDLLVSECSSAYGDGDRPPPPPPHSDQGISLVGNSIFYTPCLTCTDSANDDIAARATAINEMCRRLCTDECRLRLSLAGFEPPSTLTLKSKEALAEYVKETCAQQRPQLQHTCSEDTMCDSELYGVSQQQQLSLDEVDRVGGGATEELEDIEGGLREEQQLVTYATTAKMPITARPPSCIAIQRKKFLTNILMSNANDTDSDSSFVDEKKELAENAAYMKNDALVGATPMTSTGTVATKSTDSDQQHGSLSTQNDQAMIAPKMDQQEMDRLKDFREKYEIADALAKASAMTSTTQIRQRLAARQLEITTSANSYANKLAENVDGVASVSGEGDEECLSSKQRQQKTAKQANKRRRRRRTRQHHQVLSSEQKPREQQQLTQQKGVPANCAPLNDAFTHYNHTNNNLNDVGSRSIDGKNSEKGNYNNNINFECDDERCSCATENVCNEVGNSDDVDDTDSDSENDNDSDYIYDDDYNANDGDDHFCTTGIDYASTSKQQQKQQQINSLSDYEPPRDLLLYLVRMGSFNSAPKINNVDSQDDSLEIPKGLSTTELLQHVKHLRGLHQPQLLTRYFIKPSLTNDVTDGMRSLKLNTVAREYSMASTLPNHIRVFQWNILSQTLGQSNDGFVRCPEEALTWENRKFLLVQEILQNNPDVICLQEVDHFKFLKTILGTQNYEGIFFPKPDSPCLYIEENNGPDGCAIFYKRDKLELKNFNTRILEVWRVQSNQVAIVANLAVKATGKEFVVCTTHLKARHGALLSKLRNEQGRDLLRFVKQFAEQRPVLICGDFNAEPTEPVYATVLSGEVMKLASAYADIKAELDECNNDSADVLKMGGDVDADAHETTEEAEAADNSCNSKVLKSIKREPPYTTWKIREDGEECHTIDYVFYSPDQFKVRNCLEFPQDDEVGNNRTPSFQYPSDHFSLVCDFEILDKQQ